MAISHENAEKGAPHTTPRHREQPNAKADRTRHGDETEQLIFTVKAATGAITKIEKIDSAGKRRVLPDEETVALAGEDNLHEIEAALDEAFEAGISSVIGPADEQDEQDDESEEETELRRILLTGIIGRQIRRRLQRRLVQRLVLSRTLAH